ncbi:MAG TPA: LytTR family DNA-binding domain-containing protein [Longimicrobiaceae bacterium]|jgi:two-component system LytT family response regulator
MKIRTLIVDDEPLARDGVRIRLEREPDFEVLGECGNGADAAEAILELEPDLVFLDVQMPGVSGFGVLEALAGERLPHVVFVTAFDQYAVRAFEVHALDYLLKPFDDERFADTLARVRARLADARSGSLGRQLAALAEQLGRAGASAPSASAPPEGRRYADRLVIRDAARIRWVRVDELDWIEADGDYMRLHSAGTSHLLRKTMAELERSLDPRRFLRIHRSTIVNLDRVREMQPYFHGEYSVILHDGTRLKLSRGYRPRLQAVLEEEV